ncbi:ATP-binding protein [Senegalia massiliensis]|uniref:ATP-binding protein n=1 Tax=Senegalia massiliensis TaxID=1720316 RepID=UPI0013630E43
MILIFFGLIVFLIFLFALIQIITTNKTSKNIMEQNLSQLVVEKKELLDLRMKQVELEVKGLGGWLYGYTKEDFNIPEAEYKSYGDIIIDPKGKDKTSLFITNKTDMNKEVIDQISLTANMEDKFMKTIQRNKDIVCVYAISSEGVLRVYPYMDIGAFSPNHDFIEDYYFEEALEKNNPHRKIIWTKPYYDWAGRGWIVTCVYPVYINNELSYVVFADVTLKFLQETMGDFRINNLGYGFIIDYDGQIIYHPKYKNEPLNKGEKVYANIFDLNKNSSLKAIVEDMTKGNNGQAQYYRDDDNCDYLLSYTSMDRLKWSIGFDVNMEKYDINTKSYINRYFFIPIVISTMILIFGYYLLKKMAQPIEVLSDGAEKIASGEFIQLDGISAGEDIDTIANSLNILSLTVKDYMNNLIKANNKLEAVFNSISGVLFIIDKNYNIISMNRYGKKITQSLQKEPIGSKCYSFFKKRETPCKDCPMVKTIKISKESFKEMLHNQDIFHIWTFPIFDDKENIEEVVVYSMKVTKKAILEKEFHQREKLAVVGQMAAGVTHELKNPLSVIKGCNYLLKQTIDLVELDKELNIELEEIIIEIENSINRSENIIHNLLNFSRKSNVEKEKIDLAALLEQIIILNKKYIIDQNIELSLELQEKPLHIYGNLDSMKHILINIIENAIQAMPDGGYLKVLGRILSVKKIAIEIEDTGYGIDEKILDYIFKPFFTTKHKENGTGIGLWIVKNELDRNNGDIKVSSVVDKGTKISLVFQKLIIE